MQEIVAELLFAGICGHGRLVDNLLVFILPFADSVSAFAVEFDVGSTVFAIEKESIGALKFALVFSFSIELANR